MKKFLLLKLSKMEANRKSLLTKIVSYPSEKIFSIQKQGGWSAVQILEHLRVSEKQTLNAIKKTLDSRTEFQFATTRSDLAVWITQLLFLIGVKFKAPQSVSSQIPQNPDIEHIISDWQKTRTEIKEILEKMSAEMLYKIIFKHPYLGLMSIKHVLQFQHSHFNLHKKQIERILKM